MEGSIRSELASDKKMRMSKKMKMANEETHKETFFILPSFQMFCYKEVEV